MKKIFIATGVVGILVLTFFLSKENTLLAAFRVIQESAGQQSASAGVIMPQLEKEINQSSSNRKFEIEVLLKKQAETRGIQGNYKEIRRKKEAIVAQRESERGLGSPNALVIQLQKEGHIASLQKRWLVNSYGMSADSYAIRELAKNIEVAMIDFKPKAILDAGGSGYDFTKSIPLQAIKAFDVWNMGYKGKDIKVGIVDTNVYEAHPALQGKMALIQSGKNSGKKAYFNSYTAEIIDPGTVTTSPHGTHVAGIIIGGKVIGSKDALSENKDIGVAPEAQYIFSNMGDVVSAFQWMADPDEDPATADFPRIINCSWHLDFYNPILHSWINALNDLGVTMVVAAGNTSTPQSISETWNYPALVLVANYNMYTKHVNTAGSSQGPIEYNGESYIKPDIAAPGMGILSSVQEGDWIESSPSEGLPLLYKQQSGTSMAAPHVAGAVALMQQAYFEKYGSYLSPSKVANILELTAKDLGDNDLDFYTKDPAAPTNNFTKDNFSGSGLVDVSEAVKLALNHGTLKGTIKNNIGESIPFVKIQMTYNGIFYQLNSDHNGEYELALPAGIYSIDFEKSGQKAHLDTEVKNEQITTKDLNLNVELKEEEKSGPASIELKSSVKIISFQEDGEKLPLGGVFLVDAIVKDKKGNVMSMPISWKIVQGSVKEMAKNYFNGKNYVKITVDENYEGLLVVRGFIPGLGQSLEKDLSVFVLNEHPKKITIQPKISTLSAAAQQFQAFVGDKNGKQIAYPFIKWSSSGVGSIDQNGLYETNGMTGKAKITGVMDTAVGIGDSFEFDVVANNFLNMSKYSNPQKIEKAPLQNDYDLKDLTDKDCATKGKVWCRRKPSIP